MEQRDDSGEVPIQSRVHKRERLLLRRMSVSRHREGPYTWLPRLSSKPRHAS